MGRLWGALRSHGSALMSIVSALMGFEELQISFGEPWISFGEPWISFGGAWISFDEPWFSLMRTLLVLISSVVVKSAAPGSKYCTRVLAQVANIAHECKPWSGIWSTSPTPRRARGVAGLR